MKTSGRYKTELTTRQIEIVNTYINSNLGYQDVADKYNVPLSTVKYWVSKYRKQASAKRAIKLNGDLSNHFDENSLIETLLWGTKLIEIAKTKAVTKYNVDNMRKPITIDNITTTAINAELKRVEFTVSLFADDDTSKMKQIFISAEEMLEPNSDNE